MTSHVTVHVVGPNVPAAVESAKARVRSTGKVVSTVVRVAFAGHAGTPAWDVTLAVKEPA